MKKDTSSNPVLKFRESSEMVKSTNGEKIRSQGTMITETREQIDTSESSI